MQSDSLRSDGGTVDDEMTCEEVWAIVDDIEYSRHFIRFLAIAELDQEGVWPINSSSVRTRVKEMTGADERPSTKSVLTSMRRFENIGALNRNELKGRSGDHWSLTDLGRRLARNTAIEWCRMFGFDEAADTLANESIDSDE